MLKNVIGRMTNLSQTSAPPRLRYPYEEFADHIRAMKLVRQWEYTARFGHLGESQTSQANNARVLEYFSDCYDDQKEAIHKAELFLSIYDYIARNASLFSRKRLLDRDAENFSADPALLRAVHHIFTVAESPANVPAKGVLHLARAFQRISNSF